MSNKRSPASKCYAHRLRHGAHRSFQSARGSRGAAMPFLIFSVLVIAAFLAFTVDVMRNATAVRKLQFAAEAGATHALSMSTDEMGNYSLPDAENRVRAALSTSGGSAQTAWNSCPIGPADWKSGPYTAGVAFAFDDVVLSRNPADDTEIWVQVTARRRGDDALRMAFLPMILALNARDGGKLPPNAYQVEPFRTIEVIGQPASRIGAGPSRTGSLAGTRAAELKGQAVFPLGITLREFQLLALPGETRRRYIVDMQASNSPTFNQPAPPGHLKGYFVNVTATGGADYYGEGRGNLAVDQLLANLRYFRTAADTTENPPAAVERGGRLAWFDQADATFISRKSQIMAVLRQLPLRNYVMPVLRDDPLVGSRNEVVGFARLRLAQVVNASGTDIEIFVDVADSVPVRNASCATGFKAIPSGSSTQLPEPVPPFRARRQIGTSDGIDVRSRGIALAPALSPRQFRVAP